MQQRLKPRMITSRMQYPHYQRRVPLS